MYLLSWRDSASPVSGHLMLFSLFSKCKAWLGQSFLGHFCEPRPSPPPTWQCCLEPSFARAGVMCRPGWVFVVSLGCTPPSPMATLAHFSWELPSCRERPLEPFSFQSAFIEFHLHFFPFQIGTSFILDFKLQRSLRAFSFPSCICWHTVNLFLASTPLLPFPPPKQAIKCLQLCLYYPSFFMPTRRMSWNIAQPLLLTKRDNLKTFLLFFGKADGTKESASFYCKCFLNMGHLAIISRRGRKSSKCESRHTDIQFSPLAF